MKYLFIFSSLAFITLFSTSCDNDFNINDDWKDITVVYGLLDANPDVDTNWIRVQRAYLGNAAQSASYGEPDSLYYDTTAIDVYILEYERGSDGSLGQPTDTLVLHPDFTSRKLDDGVFTSDGFRLYYTTEDIDEDKTYRLVVKKKNANYPDASSITEIVGAHQAGSTNSGFRFFKPNPNIPSARIFSGIIQWSESNLALIYEADIYFFYREVNRKTGAVENLSVKIDYGTLEGVQAIPNSDGKFEVGENRNDFYVELSNNLPPLKPNTFRFFKSFTMVVWAGGEDLAKYIEINKPTLGVNKNKPEFPDIENGTGLFSSRTSIVIDNVDMDDQMSTNYYLSRPLCDDGFAILTSGDTCYCENISGLGPTQRCK